MIELSADLWRKIMGEQSAHLTEVEYDELDRFAYDFADRYVKIASVNYEDTPTSPRLVADTLEYLKMLGVGR